MRKKPKNIVKCYPKTFLSMVFVLFVTALYVSTSYRETTPLIQDIIRSEQSRPGALSYRAVPPHDFPVRRVATLIPYLTDMVITPDNSYILAATLQGKIFALKVNADGTLEKQSRVFYDIHTSDIGYPRIEIGLTGIVLGADFETSGDVFLLYSYDNGEGQSLLKGKDYKARIFENRITKVHFNRTINGVYGTQATVIFSGDDLTSQAHQISRGVGVRIQGKPHVLFTIGDGYQTTSALDVSDEAGKMLIIQSDGSNPLGERPYPNEPLIQAVGMRNGSSISLEEKTGRILVTDTSNENFDRLLYGKIFDTEGTEAYPLSFLWNGNDTVLLNSIKNPYESNKEFVIHRWSPAETPVDNMIVDDKVIVVTFGETKSTRNKPGKRILVGDLVDGMAVEFKGLIERDPGAYGKLGNPISIIRNPENGYFYFADFEEGNIYSFKLR